MQNAPRGIRADGSPQIPQTPLPNLPGVTGPSLTGAQLEALNTRKSILTGELTSLTQRREALSVQVRNANGLDRVGLERQLRQADQLIIQTQADLDATIRQQAGAPVTATTVQPPQQIIVRRNEDVAMMGILASTLLLFPFVIVMARRLLRRSVQPTVPAEWKDTPARIERLEQAVDTVAIEVERISEGQRFITKLLMEAPIAVSASPRALGAGEVPMPTVRVAEKERV